MIISAKKGIFIAGADIKEIVTITDLDNGYQFLNKVHEVFSKLANLPFPTIAVIDGACMGGGTEMSLACTYRLASDNPRTKIALPEVNIGTFSRMGRDTTVATIDWPSTQSGYYFNRTQSRWHACVSSGCCRQSDSKGTD